MKTSEAMRLLEEGKKVRDVDWLSNSYIYYDETLKEIYNEDGEPYPIDGEDFEREWEEYKGHEKIKKLFDIENTMDNLSQKENWLLGMIIENRYKINEIIKKRILENEGGTTWLKKKESWER